jgi:ribosomal protein S18 acetylase RimI-like enzyme
MCMITPTLRPITDADLPLLLEIYASTRAEELAQVSWWDTAQKQAFLQQQFAAQHEYYLANYIKSSFDVIMLDSVVVGRLYVARWDEQTRIIDIALLPAHQGKGIGTALLQTILAESRARGVPVSIHVERNNPALRWYQGLGFEVEEDKGVYLLLKVV